MKENKNIQKEIEKAQSRLRSRGLRISRLSKLSHDELVDGLNFWNVVISHLKPVGEISLACLVELKLSEIEAANSLGNKARAIAKAYELAAVALQAVELIEKGTEKEEGAK